MYHISRGDIDMYSYTILKSDQAKECGGNYCSCSELKTFIYDIGAQKGNCVTDTDIQLQSGEYNEYLQNLNYTGYCCIVPVWNALQVDILTITAHRSNFKMPVLP